MYRAEMQRLAPQFQEYLQRIYAQPSQPPARGVVESPTNLAADGLADAERDADENGSRAAAGKLKIVIDWGALDVDREKQTLSGGKASDLIVKLLVELIGAFGEPMVQQYQ